MGGSVGCMEERKIVYVDYVRKSELKRKLVRPRRRWENDIKVNL
jgi:hypothetical protein